MGFVAPALRPLVAVVGPTGAGKSELALRVAESFAGEVVNCDSLQVYRHFDVGTAKLAGEQRRGIRHHLIDVLDPDQVFTAGEFARVGRELLAEISARSRLPVVTGGTGFYLRALVAGLFRGPSRDPQLRQRLALRESRRPGSLHRLLSRFDPEAAARIHAKDTPKLTRALEVCLLTRRPISQLFRQGREPLEGYAVLKLGLAPPREALYQRLDERCRQMFAAGLVEEVRQILALGFPATSKPFEALGYRQALQLLRGELTEAEALWYTQRDTRRYAKRQMTWFRQEPEIEWLQGFGDEPQVQEAALARIRDFLAGWDSG